MEAGVYANAIRSDYTPAQNYIYYNMLKILPRWSQLGDGGNEYDSTTDIRDGRS